MNGVRQDLFDVNPLVLCYRNFAQFSPPSPSAYIELADPGPGEEIAALYRIGDAPVAAGRDLYVQCAADDGEAGSDNRHFSMCWNCNVGISSSLKLMPNLKCSTLSQSLPILGSLLYTSLTRVGGKELQAPH